MIGAATAAAEPGALHSSDGAGRNASRREEPGRGRAGDAGPDLVEELANVGPELAPTGLLGFRQVGNCLGIANTCKVRVRQPMPESLFYVHGRPSLTVLQLLAINIEIFLEPRAGLFHQGDLFRLCRRVFGVSKRAGQRRGTGRGRECCGEPPHGGHSLAVRAATKRLGLRATIRESSGHHHTATPGSVGPLLDLHPSRCGHPDRHVHRRQHDGTGHLGPQAAPTHSGRFVVYMDFGESPGAEIALCARQKQEIALFD